MKLRAVGFAVLVVVVAGVGLALWTGWRSRPRFEMSPAPSTRPAVEGLEFEEFDAGHRRLAFSAARVERRPRRVGPVSVNLIDDVTLTGVTIEIETLPEESLPEALIQSVRRALDARELAGVSRLELERLRVTERHDGDAVFTLEAASAQLELGDPAIRFQQLVLASPSKGQRFVGREVRWNFGSGLLEVEGPYLLDDTPETSPRAHICLRIGTDRSIAREAC